MSIWPFKKRKIEPEPAITPPVDLNQPIENPGLVAAIAAHSKAPSDATLQEMVRQLGLANYLVAIEGELPVSANGTAGGKALLKNGTSIPILICEDLAGERLLALFTDWGELDKWAKPYASALVMTADEAWTVASARETYHGVVVNPAGQSIRLNADQVQHLRIEGAKAADALAPRPEPTSVTTADTPVQARVSQSVSPQLAEAFRQVCKRNTVIEVCMLLDVREPQSGGNEIKLLVELVVGDPTQFDAITQEFIAALKQHPIQKTVYFGSSGDFNQFLPHAFYRRP